MTINRALFSSITPHWRTPSGLYKKLDEEFHFDDDPCPINGSGGLCRPWGKSAYVNPPYGPAITEWIKKGIREKEAGKTVVFLLPARTDTAWFHRFILPYASEIRFVRKRLRFSGHIHTAPFPSMIVIFKREALP